MVSGLMSGASILKAWKQGLISKSYVRRKGSKYYIRNSDGSWTELEPRGTYYHRGLGRFARYHQGKDIKIKAKHSVSKLKYVNKGDYKKGRKKYRW